MSSANEPGRAARDGVPPAAWRHGDPKPVEAFLQLFARAVRQFHTYPPTSPMCVEAIEASQKALTGEGPDLIALRVTPREILLDEVGIGAGTIIEQELTRRLHRARVAALDISRGASRRDLSRFCSDLLRASDGGERKFSLAELLDEHGVQALVPRMAVRAEVLDVGAPPPAICNLVLQEQARRDSSENLGQAIPLYPPGRGWVRVDPSAGVGNVSLVDLAVLVDDPRKIASMLLRLTDDEAAGGGTGQTPLERKYSEIASLFSALDPRLARLMFAKLARAVLDLEPEHRQALLRRTILPGLFEGSVDAAVLQDFPDPDLAESLCLLLDLETAAPHVLSAALDRMELSAERREAMVPLLEARMQARADAQAAAAAAANVRDSTVDQYARKRLKVNLTGGRRYEDFSAFDLSIDEPTTAALERIRAEASAADATLAQIDCLAHLVQLETNPDTVAKFLGRTAGLLADLERASRWSDIAAWLARHREMAGTLRPERPDVADAIVEAIGRFCTPERALSVVELYEAGGDSRALGAALFEGYGAAMASACLAILDDAAAQTRHRMLLQLMCEHAARLAPELAARSAGVGESAARAILTVFGCAGAGYETSIAQHFRGRDEQTVREGLRALAKIGTGQAAGFVAAQLDHPNPRVRAAAEESLWRFSPARVQVQLRELLGKRDFVFRHPAVAARLLDRLAQAGADSMEQTLLALAPLRFRFWNPALAQVGRKARTLVKR